MRIFIAIDIPENIKKEILRIQNSLPKFNGKKTEYENLHLTLKFLGEIDGKEIEKIKQKLRKIKLNKFEAEINSIGMFSDRIIWLGIKNCDELQKEIDSSLSELFEKEDRFMGHLTIARIKEIKEKKLFLNELKKLKISQIKFIVNEFNLKKSKLSKNGPIYENIEAYKLEI